MDEANTIKLDKEERTKIIGKIIKIDKKGYGFITSVEIPFTRIFFHWTALDKDSPNYTQLKIGMRVRFTPIELINKGWRAINVEVL